MMADLFAILCALAAVVATFSSNIKTAVLALWVSGLAVGGLYLTLGTDTLAVTQWIVGTLIAVSFVFFSMMFGEFSTNQGPTKGLKIWAKATMHILMGGAFAAMTYFGIHSALKEVGAPGPMVNDLGSTGRIIANHHFLSFEILALLLFLVLIGGGVVARPERGDVES